MFCLLGCGVYVAHSLAQGGTQARRVVPVSGGMAQHVVKGRGFFRRGPFRELRPWFVVDWVLALWVFRFLSACRHACALDLPCCFHDGLQSTVDRYWATFKPADWAGSEVDFVSQIRATVEIALRWEVRRSGVCMIYLGSCPLSTPLAIPRTVDCGLCRSKKSLRSRPRAP
jgi:hypothetical protein